MKKLSLILAIVLLPMLASAATISWEHSGEGSPLGFTIYFWETDSPGEEYNVTFGDGSVRQGSIDDVYFAPNVEYTFVGTAYNASGESPRCEPATWVREVPAYEPPANQMPSEVTIVDPPPAMTIQIGQ